MSQVSNSEPVVAAEKPTRRVVTKRAPSKKDKEAAVAPAPVDEKKDVAVVPAEAPKKRKPAAKKAKTETADAPAAAVVDAAPAAVAAASTSEPAAVKEKRVRVPKEPREFIVAYGDLAVDEKSRLFTKEAFEEWKTLTKAAVEQIRYKEWERAKRDFYRTIRNLQKKKKRVAKGFDWEATAENHLRRLKEMPKDEFKDLDGAWLSNYQFSGSFDAASLNKDGCPEKGAIPTYTVYMAALHHGFKPAGIVSENGTRNGDQFTFTTPVDGRREYVGVALPFQNKERSKFSVILKDRVQNDL